MYQPIIFNYLSTYITGNIVFYTITTISTSIMSIQNISKFIVEHKDSYYKVFHDHLEETDMMHKLNMTNFLIKDIIKSRTDDKEKIDKIFLKIGGYDEDLKSDKEFSVVCKSDEFDNINMELPEPVKASIITTLEIIHKINDVFEEIYKKIINYNKSYFNLYKLNILNEINYLSQLNKIFNDRLELMIKIIDIYKNKI
jgi:hypothetical protein